MPRKRHITSTRRVPSEPLGEIADSSQVQRSKNGCAASRRNGSGNSRPEADEEFLISPSPKFTRILYKQDRGGYPDILTSHCKPQIVWAWQRIARQVLSGREKPTLHVQVRRLLWCQVRFCGEGNPLLQILPTSPRQTQSLIKFDWERCSNQ